LLGARAEAAGVVEGRLSADTGYDSNIYRNFNYPPGSDLQKAFPVIGDAFLQLQGDIAGRAEFTPGQRSDGSLVLGVRLFPGQGGADTYVGLLKLGHAIRLSQPLTLRFDAGGKVKEVQNGDSSYSDVGAGVTLSASLSRALGVDARVGVRAFNYFPDSAYSEIGPSFSVGATQNTWKDQNLFFIYRLLPEYYDSYARMRDLTLSTEKRFDWFHIATIGYTLQRPVLATLTSSFIYDHSNSWGESYVRYRLEGLCGVNLPLDFTFTGTAALQFTTYPDGIYLSPQVLLVEDDDNLTELSLKLYRELTTSLSLEARYSIYRNDLSQSVLAYRRQIFYIGITFRP
jgi:hypothetical protein